MNDVRKMGRVTIPTDTDAVSETLNLLKRWGADAIRDCDGTEFPQELKDTGAKGSCKRQSNGKRIPQILAFGGSPPIPQKTAVHRQN